MAPETLLVVDDEHGIRSSLAGILGDEGWAVDLAESGEAALVLLRERSYRAIFLDVWLPGIDGIETLRQMRRAGVDAPVILISGHGNIDTAVRATKLGAFDFVEKPLSLEKILLTLRNALRTRKLEQQSRSLREQLRRDNELVGDSPAIRRLREEIERAGPSPAPVLLSGESGAGKELVARLLVARSGRADEAFVTVNCAAIPPGMIEAELFGRPDEAVAAATAEGGPTAAGARKGRTELAHEGTLFLEEVTGLPPATQTALLGMIETGEIMPGGGGAPRQVNVRLISATTRDLAGEVAAGRFRADLAQRLSVLPLRVPPLRERFVDIEPLAGHFLARFAREYGRETPALSGDARDALVHWVWPGNVRELRNLAERLVILHAAEIIESGDLPETILDAWASRASGDPAGRSASPATLRSARDEFERSFIRARLEEAGGNMSRAAQALGLERSHLYRKMKLLGMRIDEDA